MMKLLEEFLSLLFPLTCVHCQGGLVKGEINLCTHCRVRMPITDYNRISENEVSEKFHGVCKISRAAAYLKFRQGGIAQSLLHQIKYQGKRNLAVDLGAQMGHWMMEAGFHVDEVIPVPLNPVKLKKRGYNQSTLLACGIARVLGCGVTGDFLHRISDTQSQTSKGRIERWENMEGQFYLNGKEVRAKNKSYMLVDDVITTGATACACITALQSAGLRNVNFCALASA